jgi:hypothetical protein
VNAEELARFLAGKNLFDQKAIAEFGGLSVSSAVVDEDLSQICRHLTERVSNELLEALSRLVARTRVLTTL